MYSIKLSCSDVYERVKCVRFRRVSLRPSWAVFCCDTLGSGSRGRRLQLVERFGPGYDVFGSVALEVVTRGPSFARGRVTIASWAELMGI